MELIGMLDSAISLVGSDNANDIETLTQLLVDVKTEVLQFEEKLLVETTAKDDAIAKSIALRESNSKLYRQLSTQEKAVQQAKEQLEEVNDLTSYFK